MVGPGSGAQRLSRIHKTTGQLLEALANDVRPVAPRQKTQWFPVDFRSAHNTMNWCPETLHLKNIHELMFLYIFIPPICALSWMFFYPIVAMFGIHNP